MKTYLMNKNIHVLEIDNYQCKILNYNKLPIALKYTDVNYDDVMHCWTETRTMNINKTNGKKILETCGISQRNPYMLAKAFHFTSLSDSFWMKDENEDLCWEDVNLFTNPLNDIISKVALTGKSDRIVLTPKIHSPEITTQGMAAKAWIRENVGLYLYKVGKKELAANSILNALNIPHVEYRETTDADISQIATDDFILKLKDSNEKVVKCQIISSEDKHIIPFEDFAIYCDRHNINPYDKIKQNTEILKQYDTMNVVDYILGNSDRHDCNWGFFVDNNSDKLLGLYPLMDHDHAFSNENLIAQTSEHNISLKQLAIIGIKRSNLKFNWTALQTMNKPTELSDLEWAGVQQRTNVLRIIERDITNER